MQIYGWVQQSFSPSGWVIPSVQLPDCICTVKVKYLIIVHCMTYRIAGNFWERKLSRIGEKYDFLIAHFCSAKGATPQNFAEKTFVNNHKTVNFAKVFFLWKFPATCIRYRKNPCEFSNCCEKTFMNSHKTSKFISFFPWKFPATRYVYKIVNVLCC